MNKVRRTPESHDSKGRIPQTSSFARVRPIHVYVFAVIPACFLDITDLRMLFDGYLPNRLRSSRSDIYLLDYSLLGIFQASPYRKSFDVGLSITS